MPGPEYIFDIIHWRGDERWTRWMYSGAHQIGAIRVTPKGGPDFFVAGDGEPENEVSGSDELKRGFYEYLEANKKEADRFVKLCAKLEKECVRRRRAYQQKAKKSPGWIPEKMREDEV